MSAIDGRDLFVVHRASHGDVAALRGLSLEVAAGETVAVLGPSGAGKSTLLSACAGLTRPSTGQLVVAGVAVHAASERALSRLRRDALGFVRQHFHLSLPGMLTVREIVELPLRLSGSWSPQDRRRVSALLSRAGLSARASSLPRELSGGEQQRVAVCAALVKRPALVLADEPTGELDDANTRIVVELLLELAGAAGATALIVTHDEAIAGHTQRTIHLRDGRVSAEGAGQPVLVVDRQGWVRLPAALRERAGIGAHVRASAGQRAITLAAEGERAIQRGSGAREPAADRSSAVAGAVVELVDVSKAHRRQAVLSGLSLRFSPARVHVVAGPSGSGKTTLLDLVAGLDRADSGAVLIDGRDLRELSATELARLRRLRIGHVSQHAALTGPLSALENVALAYAVRGVGRDEARDGARRRLDGVGLRAEADRRVDQLSGGELRRVAVARALGNQPGLLIVDEPTAHLDRAAGRRVIELLRQSAQQGATVIAASHDPDVIDAADELHVLRACAGRVSA